MYSEEEVSPPIDVIEQLIDEAIENAILHLPKDEAVVKVRSLVKAYVEQLDYNWRRG